MTNHNYNFIDQPNSIKNSCRFWFIRHAIVNEKDRTYLYGTKDVPICPIHLKKQQNYYRILAQKLPKTTLWFVTSLSRTQETALQIQKAGYGTEKLKIEDAFLEQNLGLWQGLTHEEIDKHRKLSSHPFWPFSGNETPPQGENMNDVCQRVGNKLKELSQYHHNQNMIIISHGGAIRAALSYSLNIPIDTALSFAIYNLSVTVIERTPKDWHIITVNEMI